MARKRESLFEQLTTMPWWASVVVAAIAYLVLTFLFPMMMAGNPVGMGLANGLAIWAPYIAIFFLLAIPFSLLNTAKRRRLIDSQRDIGTIRSLHWNDFELMIGEAFRRQGYSVEERGGSAPDGGVDLVLRKDGQKTLVQCKHWKSQQVGVSIVRELLGVMTAQSASGGIVVTAGYYTAEARDFARDNRMRLIDGDELAGMIDATQRESNRRESAIRSGVSSAEPKCPKCGSAMVKRVAKGGANVGQAFWGCSTFPKCRGTRPV